MPFASVIAYFDPVFPLAGGYYAGCLPKNIFLGFQINRAHRILYVIYVLQTVMQYLRLVAPVHVTTSISDLNVVDTVILSKAIIFAELQGCNMPEKGNYFIDPHP